MKLFGHPLHMILIHFPSALLPLDLLFSIVSVCGGPVEPVQIMFFTAAAVVLGWLAVLTGTLDLLTMVRQKNEAVTRALVHGCVNGVVLTGFTLFVLISCKTYPHVPADSMVKLVIKGALVLVLGFGNYLGGSLILKHRVAVQRE
jgi:uncharacterized membrane protein